jgi:large subunit ribosomal protein L13
MRSFVLSHKNIKKNWFIIDATDVVLGRAATQIATILIGKHKPDYTPFLDAGDNIIIINADKIKLTGNKLKDKKYYSHSGYPGGIKEITAGKLLEKSSAKLIRSAVKNMLGRGPMARTRLGNLYVYPGSEHKHSAQNPQIIDLGATNNKNKR